MRTFLRATAAALGLLVGAGSPVFAQHGEHGATAAADGPMAIHAAALGPFSRPVTTDVPRAQAYFDQGIQLMYAFAPKDAARSFREAQRLDPGCAACWWGEAWALGPYLNGGMDAADAPRAHEAITRARELAAARATPVERALIAAMAERYEPTHDDARREALDTAYATAMRRVAAAHPEDLDAATLSAEALMLLQPRRGRWDIDAPAIREIHGILERVLAADIRHPGACHLYIHATESTTRPEKAEACAEHLGNAIPGASHINHMPSHTFNRVGRWGDAVRANIQAWHSDQKAEHGEGFPIYPSHNLHMLLFAASMDGQGAIAMQAAKDYEALTGDAFYRALTMVRFGRFAEVLALDAEPEQPAQRGLWQFGRGYAHLRLGAPDSARHYLERLRDVAAASPDATFRGHRADALLGVVGGILEAELLRSEGKLEEAATALEAAVALEDGLTYDEPEPLNFSARHWLGAVLLEADRPADAERAYRAALEDHPANGWSLFGLERALRAQGRDADAGRTAAAFRTAWARADVWLRASRF